MSKRISSFDAFAAMRAVERERARAKAYYQRNKELIAEKRRAARLRSEPFKLYSQSKRWTSKFRTDVLKWRRYTARQQRYNQREDVKEKRRKYVKEWAKYQRVTRPFACLHMLMNVGSVVHMLYHPEEFYKTKVKNKVIGSVIATVSEWNDCELTERIRFFNKSSTAGAERENRHCQAKSWNDCEPTDESITGNGGARKNGKIPITGKHDGSMDDEREKSTANTISGTFGNTDESHKQLSKLADGIKKHENACERVGLFELLIKLWLSPS